MNDPHVVALIYRVTHSEGVNFDAAEPLEFETSQFTVRVENGTARFALKEHYADVNEARRAIELFIQVWETWDALGRVLSGFRLVYSTSEVVDRNPPPPPPYTYGESVLPAIRMSGRVGIQHDVMCFRYYPDPPTEQAAMNADVSVMAYRYWLYKQGRDSLGAMAYFCLSVLENSTGRRSKRRSAAERYKVCERVLREIARLTTLKGGRDARKGEGVAEEFTPAERSWLEHTVMQLIRRAADVAHDPNQQLPTIRDLPPP